MSHLSDQEIDSITWGQIKRFGKAHEASFWVSVGSWDMMSRETKRLFIEDLEKVCGVEFRLDTVAPQEVDHV